MEEDVLVLSVQENRRAYNLDERLVEFASLIVDVIEQLRKVAPETILPGNC